jgi:hypothetical protein
MNPLDNTKYHPLPELAIALHTRFNTPARLLAHHILVHHVAYHLLINLQRCQLAENIDQTAVCFGAATHDLGKTMYPNQLNVPGKQHEQAGQILLIQVGISAKQARFAALHSDITSERNIDELLVALADHLWKGKRNTALEELVIAERAQASQRDYWDVWVTISELCDRLAADSISRLAWHSQFTSTS